MKFKSFTNLLWIILLLTFSCNNNDLNNYPNIVYILADDLGMGDLGCYNSESRILTPSIDELASGGMMFMDAHSGSAVCTPTRYGILTGRYAFRTRLKSGVLWGSSTPLIAKETLTVQELLKCYGYNTACIGKWHLGLGWQTLEPNVQLSENWREDNKKIDFSKPVTNGPLHTGFDYFFGIPGSLDMPPYIFIENNQPLGIADTITDTGGRKGLTVPGFEAIDVMPEITAKAVEYIEKQNNSKPFFLYFPLTAPHTPIVPNEEFLGKSNAGSYGDFVVECDATVKKIVETLKKKNLFDNTIFIITSDNGSSPHGFPINQEIEFNHNTSNGYKGRKSHSYEGGHRVPFIVTWPGKVQPGAQSDNIVCLTDLFATLAEILDNKLNPGEAPDSYSFLSALTNKATSPQKRGSIIHHSLNGDFSIREGDWKYIDAKGHGGFTLIKEFVPDDSIQLYNIANDPYEKSNIFNEYPEKVNELKTLLEKYKEDGYSREIKIPGRE